MDDLPDTLDRLTARLDALEQRVCALEHPAETPAPAPSYQPASLQAEQIAEEAPFAQAAGVFSVLGKAMLGIAGAYLLRAVAEMSSLPRLAVAAVAIVYAIVWLVLAARVKARQWLASTIYACTSALILIPLLWELTLRFKLLPAPITAGLLFAFVVAASAVAWKNDLAPVFGVANVSAALAALALSIATHDMLPFIAALLAMLVLCEAATCCNRGLALRPLLALATDLGVWGLVFIYSGPANARVDYQPAGTAELLAPGCILFLVSASSLAFNTLGRKRTITIFEAVQTLIAFLLAISSIFYFRPQTGRIVVSGLCLVLSAASYAGVFAFFDRQENRRNYHVFATWGATLFLAACLLCKAPLWQTVCLGEAAIAAILAAAMLDRVTLRTHGLVFLAAAALVSGLPAYTFNALAGVVPPAPSWNASLAALCAVVCYVAGQPTEKQHHGPRLPHLLPAALAVCALAALFVQGVFWLTALRIAPDVFHLAFIRTLIACALALGLAFCGSRWQRTELIWIAYATLALVAVKLVFEDLRHGHMEFIAASIFFFAVTLIAVPRLARLGQRT